MSRLHRLLIIEDEAAIRRLLRTIVAPHGWEVAEATTGAAALEQVRHTLPELILLDLGLPDMDGLDLIARLKRERPVPIIVLSSRDREADKVTALDLGADDYVTKPFSEGELLARIRTALRHAVQQVGGRPHIQIGDLDIDLVMRQVRRSGERVHLSPREFDLLNLLVRHGGRILTHKQILEQVWGPAQAEEVHYLRVYIRQLRQKIEADPNNPALILTEPGIGYRFCDA